MSKPAPGVARAVVAGHGDFAAGLVSAVHQITGRGDVLVPVSVSNLSAADLQEVLGRALESHGLSVVFTDLQAGSCTMAARRLLKGHPDAVLVAGANLPMLVDFVFADGMPATEAARHAVERGRSAITVHTAP